MLKKDFYWLPWGIFFSTVLFGAFNESLFVKCGIQTDVLKNKTKYKEILQLSVLMHITC